MALLDRLKNAWNVFRDGDYKEDYRTVGYSSSYRPDRLRTFINSERTILNSILNRIAVDAATADIRHVYLDKEGYFDRDVDSGLNNCLTFEANKDQSGRAFIQDCIMSMLDEGVVCIVPVDTNQDLYNNNSIDVLTMRTGKVEQWYPDHVRVNVYNDRTGNHESVVLPKSKVAIAENPFYQVMNSPNSTLKRINRKMSLMDVLDEKNSGTKLDMIIQLPYIVKGDAKKAHVEQRIKDIELQLATSKHGIAYIDGTEHITQLNRPVENKLMEEVEKLTSMLYSQLGLTVEIMNGTADEKAFNNYQKRVIEPILSALTDAMKRAFLTKTARTQGQSVMYFNDPFKYITLTELPTLVDQLTRNEIMTSNEFRRRIGLRSVDDPDADVLRNKNLSISDAQMEAQDGAASMVQPPDQVPNGQPESSENFSLDEFLRQHGVN